MADIQIISIIWRTLRLQELIDMDQDQLTNRKNDKGDIFGSVGRLQRRLTSMRHIGKHLIVLRLRARGLFSTNCNTILQAPIGVGKPSRSSTCVFISSWRVGMYVHTSTECSLFGSSRVNACLWSERHWHMRIYHIEPLIHLWPASRCYVFPRPIKAVDLCVTGNSLYVLHAS